MLAPLTKKWRLFRAWTGGHPIWCAWQVTYRCNFRCRFCHYWHDPLGRLPEPTIDDYVAGARKLATFGSLMISLAGGEPLLRPDIADIVRTVAEFHFPFLTTNGWLLTPALARDLMQAGLWGASISIDYDDDARHDERRGADGAWAQAWRAVEMLANARIHPYQRVNVIAVLMNDNIDQLEPLLARAARYNAHFMVQPYGYLKTGSHAHAHNNGPVGPRLLDLHRRYPNFLSNPRYLAKFDQFLHAGLPGCRAGQAFFNIDSMGDVAICVERKGRPVANLYRDTAPILRRRLKTAIRVSDCGDCWYNCRGEVECLYNPAGLLASLPTLFFDRSPMRAK
ncbi:MAG: radical SAM protein [Planctomycetota bacterium]